MNKPLSGGLSGGWAVPGTSNQGALRTQIVSDPPGWAALRGAYAALHRADPDAGIFLSPDWLDGLFAAHPGQWRVLAVRDDQGYHGFLPLRARLRWSRSKARFETRLNAAGRLDLSDYVGFACTPRREQEVVTALASALADEPVARLTLRYEPTGRRARWFADALAGLGFTIDWPEYVINKGTTDQLICPVVPLPDSHDAYIAMLNARMRKRLRRATRAADADKAVTLRTSTPDSHAGDRDRILAFWSEKWETGLSDAQRAELVERYRDMLDRARAMGALYMPTLWRGDRMLGGSAHIADVERGRAHALVEGRTAEPDAVDIGMVLASHAIRHFISAGFTAYDLGHGNAPYKYRLGAQDERTVYLVADRDRGGFDAPMLPQALALIARMVRRGETDMARTALARIR